MELVRDFILQPPGCRQGTSLVAWHNYPAAKRGSFGPENFGLTTRPGGRYGASAWRRGDYSACVHERSQRARFGHGTYTTVTARTLRSRRARYGRCAHASVTARTLRSRRARFGHGAHASVTACTSRWLCSRRGTAGTVDTAGPAASAARLTRRAQRRRGQLRAAQAWRVEPPVAMAISVAQAGDLRAGGTSTARG
jgi:hypothetical protein